MSTRVDDFIPYGRQEVTQTDIDSVVSALNGDLITQGNHVPAFERELAGYTGGKYCVVVNSATSALHLACKAVGLGQGDWLWTSPISFVASANCGIYCGSRVDFVDIDLDTGLISVCDLKRRLVQAQKDNRLPKVLVVVHLAGTSCDMKEIRKLSIEYGFKVIEDASHAIGGRYNDTKVGSCKYSDICVFSFHPVKIITTGEGGCAITNDESMWRKMERNRSHGITKVAAEFVYPAAGPWSYEQQSLGFNYRMTDIQAALGLSQLKRLDANVAKRNRIAEQYRRRLDSEKFHILSVPVGVYSSYHLLIVMMRRSSPEKHRRLFCSLRDANIGVQLHYSPIHLQPFYRGLGFREGDFKNAELYAQSAMSVPLYPGLDDNAIDRVIQALEREDEY